MKEKKLMEQQEILDCVNYVFKTGKHDATDYKRIKDDLYFYDSEGEFVAKAPVSDFIE